MRADPYLAYVARFTEEVGSLAVGGYGKWRGKLVRKLDPAEFTIKNDEFEKLRDTYRAILERGDTLNDALTKLVRERGAELLIDTQ